MSRDRIIDLPKPIGPVGRLQTQYILEDYINGAGTVRWDKDRWYVTLLGKPSWPLKRVLPPRPEVQEERWIEVFPGLLAENSGPLIETLTVITRMQDTYTNDVATGIAMVLLRFFDGKAETGDWS